MANAPSVQPLNEADVIAYEMRQRGMLFTEIAREMLTSPSRVRNTVLRVERHQKAMQARYMLWLAARGNVGRSIDMGGPRGEWIERDIDG
jgi:hypothetical protein